MKKVALPTKNQMVDNHFGHCDKFIIYSLCQSRVEKI